MYVFYEIGKVYLPKSLPLTELPDERVHFTLGMYGAGDFLIMKGVCEEFFEKAGMKKKVLIHRTAINRTSIREDRQISFMKERP